MINLETEIQQLVAAYKLSTDANTAFDILYQNFRRLATTESLMVNKQHLNKNDFLWYPHLSDHSNLMGNLFFPKELLRNEDSIYTLYYRGYIMLGLLFAATFEYPLAYAHLHSAIQMWTEDENEYISSSYAPLLEIFQSKIDEVINACLEHMNGPSYFGVVCLLKSSGQSSKHMTYLNKLVTLNLIEQDARCCDEWAWYSKEKDQKQYYYTKACELGYIKSYLGLASLETDNQSSIDLCLKTESGVGYFEAAKLLRAMGKPYLYYFEKSGDLGYECGYSALADYYDEHGHTELAQTMYLKHAALGDRTSYLKITDPTLIALYSQAGKDVHPDKFMKICVSEFEK